MAIIKVFGTTMIWHNIKKLKEFMILNNIKYEDIEILSYSLN